jgi:hypothetical protein
VERPPDQLRQRHSCVDTYAERPVAASSASLTPARRAHADPSLHAGRPACAAASRSVARCCPHGTLDAVRSEPNALTWGDRGDSNPRPSGPQPARAHPSRHEPAADRVLCLRSALRLTGEGRCSPDIADGGVVASLLPGSRSAKRVGFRQPLSRRHPLDQSQGVQCPVGAGINLDPAIVAALSVHELGLAGRAFVRSPSARTQGGPGHSPHDACSVMALFASAVSSGDDRQRRRQAPTVTRRRRNRPWGGTICQQVRVSDRRSAAWQRARRDRLHVEGSERTVHRTPEVRVRKRGVAQ